MSDHKNLPVFDDNGINLADPHDSLGLKTHYISLVQAKALQQHVGAGTGNALDVGCGYGRMCDSLAALGYCVTGVDPSLRVLSSAAARHPQHTWCTGSMPNLPFQDESFDLVCLFNVARVLHLHNIVDICASTMRLVKPGGQLVIIDNLRQGDSRYIPEEWFTRTFTHSEFHLKKKIPIRSSRWPIIYLIRYGLIPKSWLERIAKWEVNRMARKIKAPKYSYHNYIFVYERL